MQLSKFWGNLWCCGCSRVFGGTARRTTGTAAAFDSCWGAADGLGCAKGFRRSRCGCSGGPATRNGGLSPLKQPTSHKFACHVPVARNMPRPGGQTPQNQSDSIPSIRFHYPQKQVFWNVFAKFVESKVSRTSLVPNRKRLLGKFRFWPIRSTVTSI